MSKMISVSSGFQYSVNIGFDLNNDEKLKNFIPTKSSLALLKDILLSTRPSSTQRARVLIGAYGKGKSHIVLTILAMLYKRDKRLFEKLLPKATEDHQLMQLIDSYYESDERILPVIITGSSTSLTQAFLLALQRTLSQHDLLDVMPETNYRAAVATIQRWRDEYPKTFEQLKKNINKIRSPILLVVDEAHNFGAHTYAKCLDDRFTYRLALSATLERHHDEEGTALLYDFFGKKCIEYLMERAIGEDKLTKYKYYPVVVHLNEDELEKYGQLSYEMSRCLTTGKNGKPKLNKRGEILALQRARLVAGASEKLTALRDVIQPYIHDNNLLVYCGATNVLDDKSDYTPTDSGDLRQIEAVTNILGNEFGMKVARFTAEESMETRTIIKEQFQKADGLQAIVAIKCLDEGVNIPGIRTAFILASTTNPKEYIQRRGRVLRKASGKLFAEIYDFVTLPRPLDSVSGLTEDQAHWDLSLVKRELDRIMEFGRLSMNPMDSQQLIWDIKDAYHIVDTKPAEDEF